MSVSVLQENVYSRSGVTIGAFSSFRRTSIVGEGDHRSIFVF